MNSMKPNIHNLHPPRIPLLAIAKGVLWLRVMTAVLALILNSTAHTATPDQPQPLLQHPTQRQALNIVLPKRKILNSEVSSYYNIIDSKGYHWIASSRGLSRYDGFHIQRLFQQEAHSLRGQSISTITEINNELWIGSMDAGLARLNLHNYELYHFPIKQQKNGQGISANYVTQISQDRFQRIWAATTDGLNLVDSETNNVKQWLNPNALAAKDIRRAFKDVVALNRNTLLVSGIFKQLFVLNLEKDTLINAEDYSSDLKQIITRILNRKPKRIRIISNDDHSFSIVAKDRVYDIDKNFKLLAQTSLSLADDKNSNQSQHTSTTTTSKTGIEIKYAQKDKHNNLWLLSFAGDLFRLSNDRKTLGFTSSKDKSSLGNPTNFSVLRNGGITFSHKTRPPQTWEYNAIYSAKDISRLEPNFIKPSRIWAKKGRDNTWVINASGEAMQITAKQKVRKKVEVPPPYNTPVFDLPHIWIPTATGVYRFNLDTQNRQLYDLAPPYRSIKINPKTSNAWISTLSGIHRLNTDGEISSFVPKPNYSLSQSIVTIDPQGGIWAFSSGEIFRFDSTQQKFVLIYNQKINLARSNSVGFYIDERSIYFFADNLLEAKISNVLANKKGAFVVNNQLKNTLTSSSIHANNCIWFIDPSSHILYSYNLNTGALMHLNLDSLLPNFNNFTLLNIDNNKALISGSNKVLYFIENISSKMKVNADQVIHSTTMSDSNGQQRLIFSPRHIIELAPNETNLLVKFGQFGYHSSKGRNVQYRLLGLSDNWINSISQSAMFLGLAPGRYQLQLKANSSEFSIGQQLTVKVKPSLWRSSMAYLTYTLLGILILLLMGYLYWQSSTAQRLAKKNLLLYAKGMQGVKQGIAVLNYEGLLQSANPAFERIVAINESELLGRDIGNLFLDKGREDNTLDIKSILRDHHNWQGNLKLHSSDRNIDIEAIISRIEESTENHIKQQEPNQDATYLLLINDISLRMQYEKNLNNLVREDHLTKLPNRYHLNQFLEDFFKRQKVIARPEELGIIFIDIDRFKNINDTLSHSFGDKMLIALAKKMSAELNQGEFLARLGGDEFVVAIIKEKDAIIATNTTAKKLLALTRQPLSINGKELYISISMGVSLYPEDALDKNTLLQYADQAMYALKSRGGNGVDFFTRQLNRTTERAVQLESDLHKAIDNDEFIMHYQAKVTLHDGELHSLEALIRWQPPGKAMIPPGEFIEAAESTGLIMQMGKIILTKVCQQINHWKAQGAELVPIAINVSPQELLQPTFLEDTLRICNEHKMPAQLIEFEITESMVMDNMENCINQLASLRNQGHKIYVDDFGTGYSSLAYLHKLPIDALKIDQSFVRDAENDTDKRNIIKTIIELANNLGLKTVAEGIETKTTAAYLKQLKCDYGQGYLFARPMPATDTKLLALLHTTEAKYNNVL